MEPRSQLHRKAFHFLVSLAPKWAWICLAASLVGYKDCWRQMPKCPGNHSVAAGRSLRWADLLPPSHFPVGRLAGACAQACLKMEGGSVGCKLGVPGEGLRLSAPHQDQQLPSSPALALGPCTLPVCAGPVTERKTSLCLSHPHG